MSRHSKNITLVKAIAILVILAGLIYPQYVYVVIISISIFIIVVALAIYVINKSEQTPEDDKRPTEWSLKLIRDIEWKCFEDICLACFQEIGMRAHATGLGADGGVDIMLYNEHDPNKIVSVVQCKAWSHKPVSVHKIRELLGVMTDVGCSEGVFITTSSYTNNAKKFAERNNIDLLAPSRLLKLIQSLPNEKQAMLLEKATAGDYKTPSCPNCGIKLISRTARKGKNAGQQFWGCRNYPKCHYSMHNNVSN